MGSSRTGRRLFVFAVTVALLAGAFFPATPARADSDVVPVPDVVGKTVEEAKAALGSVGLLVATVEVAGSPAGTVAAQKPGDGASLPVGGAVVIDVRRASTPTKAPNAVGLTTAEASSAFGSNYHLEFVPQAGPAAQRGKVVAQTPKMNDPIDLRGVLKLAFVPDDAMPPRVAVPDATGMSSAEAIQAMAAAGLHARLAQAAVPGAPSDLAIGQSPLPGTEADRYETVDVIVTTDAPAAGAPEAKPTVVVPDVIGMTESSARATLTDAGLGATVEWVDGEPAQAFLVLAQDPPAGIAVDSGSSVGLKIVRWSAPTTPPGTTKIAVPDLIGMSAWQAEDLLNSLGLLPNPLFASNPSVPALRVFSQQIVGGTWVDTGTWITFRVAQPAPPAHPVPVPNFYGRTKSAAQILAWAAGLVIDPTYVANPTKPAHRVFSQSVAAWTVVPVGTHVTVWIATHPGGPAAVAVPNLVGKTSGQAMALLAAAGLAGDPHSVWAPTKPPLKVFDQNPNAGMNVVAGTTVSFQVAKLGPLLGLVPDVLGKTAANATATLSASGFGTNVVEQIALGKPIGKVFDQDPNSGAWRPPGSVVTVRVAKSPVATRIVPNLVGKTKPEALAALALVGLAADPTNVWAPLKPAGKVFDQNPNAGVTVLVGSVVHFQIATGPLVLATIPNLQGKTAAQAAALLSAAGLGANPQNVVAPFKPIGLVFAQEPPAGTHVVPGTVVTYKIAMGLGILKTVPDLFGKTKAQALAALATAGLTGNATEEICLTCPAGRVKGQNPAAGTNVPGGTMVNFAIAKGLVVAIMTTVPNLKGLTKAQAEAALAAKGLVSDGKVEWKFGEPLNRVWAQNPSAGTLVAKGSTVHWKRNP
jgi:beta-lactam-binding protein with PASTA domain